jgi:hypothetical protein
MGLSNMISMSVINSRNPSSTKAMPISKRRITHAEALPPKRSKESVSAKPA